MTGAQSPIPSRKACQSMCEYFSECFYDIVRLSTTSYMVHSNSGPFWTVTVSLLSTNDFLRFVTRTGNPTDKTLKDDPKYHLVELPTMSR